MATAIPVTAACTVFGRGLPVAGINARKGIGELAAATISVHTRGDVASPITEQTVEQFADNFNQRILQKTDIAPDVRIVASAGGEFEFEGVVTGCQANISASGSVTFGFSVIEMNRLLTSMDLNCYPDGSTQVASNENRGEPRGPFVSQANPTGSIANRIRQLYEAAKQNAAKLENSVKGEVFAAMRAQNLLVEPVFMSLLNRSDMEPDWMEEMPDVVSTQLNNVISELLFNSKLNLWEALLAIANQTGLIYAGGFGRTGGRFRQLDWDEDSGLDITRNGVAGRNFTLGKRHIQPIGQVVAMGPSNMYSHIPWVSSESKKLSELQEIARYPDKPSPRSGKLLTMHAPTFLLTYPPVEASKEERTTVNDPEEAGAMDEIARNMKGKHDAVSSEVDAVNPLLKLWCRDQYRLLYTVGTKTSVTAPFTISGLEPGQRATSGSLNGIASTIQHNLSITADSGSATSVYQLAWVA
jgi:hypothetical protein